MFYYVISFHYLLTPQQNFQYFTIKTGKKTFAKEKLNSIVNFYEMKLTKTFFNQMFYFILAKCEIKTKYKLFIGNLKNISHNFEKEKNIHYGTIPLSLYNMQLNPLTY